MYAKSEEAAEDAVIEENKFWKWTQSMVSKSSIMSKLMDMLWQICYNVF